MIYDSSRKARSASADDQERPPICPVCGVTMVPAVLSAREKTGRDWICLECEENGDADMT